MDGTEAYRDWGVVVADSDAARALALSSTLQGAGFVTTETAYSLDDVKQRLQRSVRGLGPQILLVLIGERLLSDGDSGRARGLLDMCEEAGAGVAAVSEDTKAVTAEKLSRAWNLGLSDLLPEDMDPAQLQHRMLLLLSTQHERNRLRRRSRELETELAELRVMESRLQHLVYHDELTGLWNRRRLKDVVGLALLRAANLHRPCALILIDMDRFKLVNDLEGYEAGDRFLIEVSRVLRRAARDNNTVARIGSDEFAIVMENTAVDDAEGQAETIREELESYRFRHDGRSYRTCASVGVAAVSGEDQGVRTSELMARADQACYVAKQHGRNRVHVYSDLDPELEYLRRDYRWAPRIRDAIETDQFFFCFQPIVRVLDGRVTHYECLLRMRGRDGEVHMPGDFIPVAERTGLIHHVDMWVVDKALDFLASLPPERNFVSVSINLSGHAFRNHDLFDLLAKRLEMSWVSPTRLVFEITETAAIENMQRSRELVARLRALGCRFALDDFGSGFSTFNYLKQFPVDYLKLDGSFIVNLANDPMDQELVRHMISVARNLGKETVAEFVENAETMEILRRLGVDYVQGHHLGEALESPVTTSPLERPDQRGQDEEIALLLSNGEDAQPASPRSSSRAGGKAGE
ncbi:EAL domain-containing protein [Ectothiorhodospiraceae bacterium WFHF3C12]|nr:EAL domain-containing protein [Ectothiorhodospiraceae bacterium WFHF3C12]